MKHPCTGTLDGRPCTRYRGHTGGHVPAAAPRARTVHPDPHRRDRGVLLALAERLVGALELRNAIAGAARLDARDPEPDVLLVRHLGIEHLGRWVHLPGRPALLGSYAVVEPALAVTAGRLVGIRPGKAGTRDTPGTVTLVLMQGSTVAELPTRVDDRVDVAPREWNI